jgi:hypothetical protein
MRQYRTSGTVQGAPGNRRSYCEMSVHIIMSCVACAVGTGIDTGGSLPGSEDAFTRSALYSSIVDASGSVKVVLQGITGSWPQLQLLRYRITLKH